MRDVVAENNDGWSLTHSGAVLQIFGGRKKMSSIAVMDYSSAEGLHAQVMALAELGRRQWAAMHGEPLLASAQLQPAPPPEPLYRARPDGRLVLLEV